MKSIIVLTTSFPRNEDDDAGIFVKRLLQALAIEKIDGRILVPLDKDEALLESLDTFTVERFSYGVFRRGQLAFGAGIMPNLRRNPLLALQIPTLLFHFFLGLLRHRKGYHIVLANWVPLASVALLASLITGKPYVMTVRGEDLRLLRQRFLKHALRIVLHRAKALVTVNQSFRKELQENYPNLKGKVFTIPNGVSFSAPTIATLDTFRQAKNLEVDKDYLLYVGTLIPRKGIETLLHILCLPAFQNYDLLLCGRLKDAAYVQRLEKLCIHLKIEHRVRFEGLVSPKEVPCYLSLARFYISASTFEGRPNSVLEAFAAGLPVIASRISAHQEMIKHLENGLLFDATKLEELGVAFQSIENNPEQRQRLIEAGLLLAAEHSWSSSAQKYKQLLLSNS